MGSSSAHTYCTYICFKMNDGGMVKAFKGSRIMLTISLLYSELFTYGDYALLLLWYIKYFMILLRYLIEGKGATSLLTVITFESNSKHGS